MNEMDWIELQNIDHSGHRDRLRAKLLQRGVDGLTERELMEFLLCFVLPRQDVADMAAGLIERFGSVQNALCADARELARISGVGRRAATWLASLGSALLDCENAVEEQRPECKSFVSMFRHACRMSGEYEAPCSVQLCMDAEGGLIFRREICPSLAWGEPETLRVALGDAIASNAKGVVMLLLCGRTPRAFDEYDFERARRYGYALHRSGSALLDVIIYGDGVLDSLRRCDGIPDYSDAGASRRRLREDYDAALPDEEGLKVLLKSKSEPPVIPRSGENGVN